MSPNISARILHAYIS